MIIFPYLTTDEPHHVREEGCLFISINRRVECDLTKKLHSMSSARNTTRSLTYAPLCFITINKDNIRTILYTGLQENYE